MDNWYKTHYSRDPKPGIETEFAATIAAHAAEVTEAFKAAKALSEKYAIPFANYVPDSFKKLNAYVDDGYVDARPMELYWLGTILPVDQEFWYSSTTSCLGVFD